MFFRVIVGFLFFFIFSITCLKGQNFERVVFISLNNDSVPCNIVSVKGRSHTIFFKELHVIDSTGCFKILSPGMIKGYIRDGSFYKSASFGGIGIFMRMITEGRATLYYSEFANGGKYIFKRDNERSFNAISSSFETSDGAISQRELNLPLINSEQAFKAFFSVYFNDSVMTKRKIESGFFKLDDLESLFIGYNNEIKRH